VQTLLQVKNLKTYYYTKKSIVPAVDGVEFSLEKGESLGIVGESGCGKTTVARSIVGLLDKNYTKIESGEVKFKEHDLLKMNPGALELVRGKLISFIFQNPMSALNPVYTVEYQLAEILKIHKEVDGKEIKNRCINLLKQVGIPAPESRLKDFPHQLSGGMQQRVMIAVALACNPEIIIADEPTTALDVTIQAQILDLIRDLRNKFRIGIILITHNMGIVAEMCERILVMYGGVVVEEGFTNDIFSHPLHPYTKGLLASIPSLDEEKDKLYTIKGTVPKFVHPVISCRFSDRCEAARKECFKTEPLLYPAGEGRRVRCFLYSGEGNNT
jgi:peptide/nickel transport system ATP-binding protein/oligopeptide transport system ATP-binding protein